MKNNESKTQSADIVFVMLDGVPMAVIPKSNRAKSLFIRWGMEEGSDGIAAPYDPTDIIDSVPSNWTAVVEPPEPGMYILNKVPLPQPLMVVH